MKDVKLLKLMDGTHIMTELGEAKKGYVKMIKPISVHTDVDLQMLGLPSIKNKTTLVMHPWIPASIAKENFAVIKAENVLCEYNIYDDVLEYYNEFAEKLYKEPVVGGSRKEDTDKVKDILEELIDSVKNPNKKDIN